MNGEYAGFFDIGMVQRNEKNAIIAHGTMCLIRRSALIAAGNWSSDTICEDTDLGLTILELGFTAHYTNRRYGYGLLPDSYLAYKRQRDRWAYGGFQIMKKHGAGSCRAAACSPASRSASSRWAGCHGSAPRASACWWRCSISSGAVRRHRRHRHPRQVLTIPIMAAFAVSFAHFVWLYRLRVRIPGGQMLGAVFAAMGLQWTVARAVGFGLIKDGLPFVRTAKGGSGRRSVDFPAFWEAVIGALLVGSAIFLHATNWEQVREIDLFALALAIQSLPFLASVGLAVLEGSRVNDFAFWNGLEAGSASGSARCPWPCAARCAPRRLRRAGPVPVPASDKQAEPAEGPSSGSYPDETRWFGAPGFNFRLRRAAIVCCLCCE